MPGNEQGTLELIAQGLANAVSPLVQRLERGGSKLLIAQLGIDLPSGSAALNEALDTLMRAGEVLPDVSDELIARIEAGDTLEMGVKAAEVVQQVVALTTTIDTLVDEIENLSVPGLTPAEVAAFVADIPERLVPMLIHEHLQGRATHSILSLLGLLEEVRENVGAPQIQLLEYKRKALRFDRLGTALTDPEQLLEDLYGWGSGAVDGNLLLERIYALLRNANIPVARRLLPDGRVAMEFLPLAIQPTTGVTPPGLEALLNLDVSEGVDFSVDIVPGLTFLYEATGSVEARTGIQILPPAELRLIPPSGKVQGDIKIGLGVGRSTPGELLTLLGVAGGSGLFAERISGLLVAGFTWDPVAGEAVGELGFEGRVDGGKLRISADGADGFLADVLSGIAMEADFDLGFGWTSGGGVFFDGSAALIIQLPAHIDLGPVKLSAITFTVGLDGASFPIDLALDIHLSLGPISAVVEQIGASIDIAFAQDGKGNAGPLDIAFSFKPPAGAGLAIDAGVVKGGGYLFFDPDNGEYAGALELDLAGIVTVKAIALITTRMPDGTEGFSLLVVITAEFGNGIQLGFGFTLLGVGGILGLHRTMALEALVQGVASGSIDNVMFPANVIENAPRIISDLKAYFPVRQDRFLTGPLAKLGWGTPTLVSLSLGVVIEIPGNIAILGVLKVALPDEDAALLVLQVSFIGAIEFDKERAWFFASLFDSRVLFMTIEGDMGLLIGWGSDANFVVSVGGFHPSYQPPPLPFPVPRRVSVVILNQPFGRIRAEGYFAVTSNTAQFGAGIEILFGFSGASVEGRLNFDALFQFSPFYFIIQISGSLSLKAAGLDLLSVRLRFTLEGPTPWRAKGRGKVKLLFFSISANFDFTWGESQDTSLPPIDVMPLLEAEFAKDENWTAELPASHQLSVSLRELPESDALVLHPVGSLRVTQRAVPLDITIDKVGNRSAADVRKVSLAPAGGDFVKVADVDESFASGQFLDLDAKDKLSRKGYETEHGGLDLNTGGDDLELSLAAARTVRYELTIIDTRRRGSVLNFVGISDRLFDLFLGRNAAARSPLSFATKAKLEPFAEKIEVRPGGYTVASTATNQAVAADAAYFTSAAQAEEYLAGRLGADPALAGTMHVVESFEAVAP